ncbi:hypothetical protein AOLI_G00259050 [Acnodon oligacanthus]
MSVQRGESGGRKQTAPSSGMPHSCSKKALMRPARCQPRSSGPSLAPSGSFCTPLHMSATHTLGFEDSTVSLLQETVMQRGGLGTEEGSRA